MNSVIVYSEDTDAIVESLLKTNESPSDIIRLRLFAKLETLQQAFRRIAGRPFAASLEAQEEVLSEEAEAYRDSIQQYISVLSSKRCVPIEIWQYIFELFPFVEWMGDEGLHLQSICSVSKLWRTAAIAHCVLRARPPSIDCDYNSRSFVPRPTHKIKTLTQRYLLRSGQAPLTVDYRASAITWDDSVAKERYQKLLQLLTDQCHRWEAVNICLPIDAFNEVLPCIQGNLPMLKKLLLGAHCPSSAYSFSDTRKYLIGCFREAPLLRDVGLSITSAFAHNSTVLTIDLPWSQLITFSTMSGADTMCHDLIRMRPSHLRSMYLLYRLPSPPLTESPVTLPELETLHLYVNQDSLSLTSLFDILTLPALSQLFVRADFDAASANSMCPRSRDRNVHYSGFTTSPP